MKRKTVFIVPGYNHRPRQKAYRQIAKIFKSEGYYPIPVTIPWRQTTISENTEYFLKRYKTVRSRNKYILGFSYGAMIAFIASTKVSVCGLILCSLSPYFKEDISEPYFGSASSIRAQRYRDFSGMHCATLAKQIKAKQIRMLYGKKEEKSVIKRATQAYRQIITEDKYLVPIEEAEHNIADKRYLQTIHQMVKQLN